MKKLLTALLIATFVLNMTPRVQADSKPVAPTPSGNIQQRIEQLAALFPHGSFFSADGSPCSHERRDTCDNCSLSNIMRSLGYDGTMGINESWTCVSLARYSFYYIFGVVCNTPGYSGIAPVGATLISVDEMKIGDVAVWKDRHWALYLGDGVYYQSNMRATNQVDYGTKFAADAGAPDWAFRADNYYEINGGAVVPAEPTEPTEPAEPGEPIEPELFFPTYSGSSNSIVDALVSLNIDPSFAYRAQIAAANGIGDYEGSVEHNVFLLSLLRKGELRQPDDVSVEPPEPPPELPDPLAPCKCGHCETCGFDPLKGGKYGFGRVTNSNSSAPAMADALAILRYVVKLSSPIDTDAQARAAACITRPESGEPAMADALAVLRFIVYLSNPLDEYYTA